MNYISTEGLNGLGKPTMCIYWQFGEHIRFITKMLPEKTESILGFYLFRLDF